MARADAVHRAHTAGASRHEATALACCLCVRPCCVRRRSARARSGGRQRRQPIGAECAVGRDARGCWWRPRRARRLPAAPVAGLPRREVLRPTTPLGGRHRLVLPRRLCGRVRVRSTCLVAEGGPRGGGRRAFRPRRPPRLPGGGVWSRGGAVGVRAGVVVDATTGCLSLAAVVREVVTDGCRGHGGAGSERRVASGANRLSRSGGARLCSGGGDLLPLVWRRGGS